MTRRSAAFALLLAAGVVAATLVPKALKPPPTLDGRWETTERVHSGKVVNQRHRWEIEGERLAPFAEQGPGEWAPTHESLTFTLVRPDPAKPDEVDYRYTDGRTVGIYPGRMKWDGDGWAFCMAYPGQDRPAEVTSGPNVSFFRFRRAESK